MNDKSKAIEGIILFILMVFVIVLYIAWPNQVTGFVINEAPKDLLSESILSKFGLNPLYTFNLFEIIFDARFWASIGGSFAIFLVVYFLISKNRISLGGLVKN